MGWEIYKSSVNRYDPQPRPESRNACGPAVPAKHAAPRHPSRSVAILALVETHRGNHGAKTQGEIINLGSKRNIEKSDDDQIGSEISDFNMI